MFVEADTSIWKMFDPERLFRFSFRARVVLLVFVCEVVLEVVFVFEAGIRVFYLLTASEVPSPSSLGSNTAKISGLVVMSSVSTLQPRKSILVSPLLPPIIHLVFIS